MNNTLLPSNSAVPLGSAMPPGVAPQPFPGGNFMHGVWNPQSATPVQPISATAAAPMSPTPGPVNMGGGFTQGYRNALMDWRAQRPDRGGMQFGDYQQQLMGWRQDRPHFFDFMGQQSPMATPGGGGTGAPLQGNPIQPQIAPQHNQIVSQMPVNGVGTTMGVIGAMGGSNGQFPVY